MSYFTFCDSASMLLGRWSRLLLAMCAVAVASGLRSRRFFISSVLLSINSGVAAPCSDNCIACKIDVVKRLIVTKLYNVMLNIACENIQRSNKVHLNMPMYYLSIFLGHSVDRWQCSSFKIFFTFWCIASQLHRDHRQFFALLRMISLYDLSGKK